MPETACLHIQASDTDPVRVVGLTGGSVRIGRGASCDVRLPDPDVAEEECRLRRRGETWQVVPTGSSSTVWLDGRRVEGPSPVPFGAPLRVGTHSLTLQPPVGAAAPWNAAPTRPSEVTTPEAAGTELVDRHRAEWQSRSTGGDRWLQTHRETKRWESRFRAAGEKLRAADRRPATHAAESKPQTTAPPITPAPPRPAAKRPPTPADAERARRAELLRGGSTRRAELRPTPAPVPGSTPPPARPIKATPVTPPVQARATEARRPTSPRPVDLSLLEARIARPEPVQREPVAVPEPSQPAPAVETVEQPRAEVLPVEMVASPVEVETPAPADDVAPPTVEPTAVAWAEPEVQAAETPRAEDDVTVDVDVEDDFEDDDTYDGRDEGPTAHRKLGATHRVSRDGEPEPVRAVVPTVEIDGDVVDGDGWKVEAEPIPAHNTERGHAAPEDSWDRGRWAYQTPFVTDTNCDGSAADRGAHWAAAWDSRPRTGRASDDALRAAADVGVDRKPIGRPAAESNGPHAAREWPTVADILATHRVGSAERGTGASGSARRPKKAAAQRPAPTVSAAPEQWRLPLWLGWLPTSAAAAGVGLVGLAGALTWSGDAYNAGVVSRRLAANEKFEKPLPKGVAPGSGRWWETTAPHLIQWAVYLDKQADDPVKAEEARELLAKAAQVSPLNPTVRHAVARVLPGEAPSPTQKLALGLGQSRDVLTLTLAGHQLLEAGRKDAALGVYRAALAMAATVDPKRHEPATFLDDVQPRRYAVPTEDRLAAVIRDMADSPAWSYKDWADALPKGTAAHLAAARVLREKVSPDADDALAAAVAEAETETVSGQPPADPVAVSESTVPLAPGEAVRLAAGAAALAMKQRWAEARDRYRLAIDRTPGEADRRALWLNVADLALRLNEDADRRVALDAAKSADTKDEITERAVKLQKESGFVAQRTPGMTPDGPTSSRP